LEELFLRQFGDESAPPDQTADGTPPR
jgi:hypothetical protein